MAVTYWIGLGAGMLLGAAKVLALTPLFHGRVAPWGRWVAQIQALRPDTVIAAWAGHILVAIQGGIVGLAYAASDAARAPLFGSVVVQGLLIGVLGLALSTIMLSHPVVRGQLTIRAWVGIALSDLLHGASVGVAFLIWGPITAR